MTVFTNFLKCENKQVAERVANNLKDTTWMRDNIITKVDVVINPYLGGYHVRIEAPQILAKDIRTQIQEMR